MSKYSIFSSREVGYKRNGRDLRKDDCEFEREELVDCACEELEEQGYEVNVVVRHDNDGRQAGQRRFAR